MEKIAFNIKYRAEIEAGKYRIEARCGSAVRILCWDRVGADSAPIIASVNMFGSEVAFYYRTDGTLVGGCADFDLMLVPAENLDEIEAFDRWRSLHKQVTKRDCFVAGIAFAEGRLQLALKTGKNLPNWMILKIQEVEKFAKESAEADQRSQLPHWFPVVEGLNFPRPARYLLESGGAMYYCSGETCPRNGYALLVDDLLNFPKDTAVPAGDGAVALADFSEQEKQKPAEWSEEDIQRIRKEEYTKGFNDAAFGGKLKEWGEDLKKEFEMQADHFPRAIIDELSDDGKIRIHKELYAFARHFAEWGAEHSSSSDIPKDDKLRYCVEYINPYFPLLDNGDLNVRHLRVPDEHWAEMAITLILSFGGKIYALYRGNVKDGKLADWPTPIIVESEDWFTDEWLHELIDCVHNCL